MDYGLIGKIEKAKRYAQEPHRFKFQRFEMTFHGDNNDHHIRYENGAFQCDCEFFITHQRCSHTMALERVFKDMLNP